MIFDFFLFLQQVAFQCSRKRIQETKTNIQVYKYTQGPASKISPARLFEKPIWKTSLLLKNYFFERSLMNFENKKMILENEYIIEKENF